jgi:hypothetical protein
MVIEFVPATLHEPLRKVDELLRFLENGLARIDAMEPCVGEDRTRTWVVDWHRQVSTSRARALRYWASGEWTLDRAVRELAAALDINGRTTLSTRPPAQLD